MHSDTYEAGLLLFLTGLWLLIFPASHHLTGARVASLVVVGLAWAIELWWSVARLANAQIDRANRARAPERRLLRSPHPSIRTAPATINLSKLTDTELAAVLGSRDRGCEDSTPPEPGHEGRKLAWRARVHGSAGDARPE